jgi:hypothetical protein
LAVRSLSGHAGPYGLPLVLAGLKVPTGALTGLVGAMLIQNGVVGTFMAQPGPKILVYVVIFGYSQEAFTTFVDKQGKQILG